MTQTQTQVSTYLYLYICVVFLSFMYRADTYTFMNDQLPRSATLLIFSSADIICRPNCMPPQLHCMCPKPAQLKIFCACSCSACPVSWVFYGHCMVRVGTSPEANKFRLGRVGNWFQDQLATGSSWEWFHNPVSWNLIHLGNLPFPCKCTFSKLRMSQ